MTIAYFDSSAFVKLVLDEPGSDLAATLWNACDAATSSRLAYPEVCAAIAAAGRNHDLTKAHASAAVTAWDEFWAWVRPVELTATVAQGAGDLARTHRLRGADAVHLASALALGAANITMAVWDPRLHAGADEIGLALAPATLP